MAAEASVKGNTSSAALDTACFFDGKGEYDSAEIQKNEVKLNSTFYRSDGQSHVVSSQSKRPSPNRNASTSTFQYIVVNKKEMTTDSRSISVLPDKVPRKSHTDIQSCSGASFPVTGRASTSLASFDQIGDDAGHSIVMVRSVTNLDERTGTIELLNSADIEVSGSVQEEIQDCFPENEDKVTETREINRPTFAETNKRKRRLTAKGLSYVRVDSLMQKSYYDDCNYDDDDANEVEKSQPKQKRNGLSLEVKIDIIKRVQKGEKQGDIACEYGLNRYTVSTILKKSDVYLQCWKQGAFNPETKRLKGAKREDLENVLFYWYQRAMDAGNVLMTGSVLCSKAMEFAMKLGYTDFKASHGWLDRFKKRKGIVFNKVMLKKQQDDAKQEESPVTGFEMSSPLGDALLYHDPSNVFTLHETGLFYRALPSSPVCLSNDRCAGGVHSSDRLSVLLCTNMSATEKFPLLVVGVIPKLRYKLIVPESPVQYISDADAWLTRNSIFAWLLDLDDWFAQHRRKVMMILSVSPIHEFVRQDQFSALTLYHLPSNSVLPLQTNIVTSFKISYRQGLLHEIVHAVHNQQQPSSSTKDIIRPTLPMNVYINLLAKAWQNITEAEIIEGFQRAGITRYGGAWPISSPQDSFAKTRPELLEEYIRVFGPLPAGFCMARYVQFDDILQVCDELSVDDMIAKVLGTSTGEVGKKSASSSLCLTNNVKNSLQVVREYVESKGQTEMVNIFYQFQELLQSVC